LKSDCLFNPGKWVVLHKSNCLKK